jgi:hypothetical protein
MIRLVEIALRTAWRPEMPPRAASLPYGSQ